MSGREVSELLYDGETVEREVEIGSSRFVVTSHRMLAFTPKAPGKNFRKVDRPNVGGVEVGTESNRNHLVYAVSAVILAIPFIAGSRLLDFDGMFADLETGAGARAIGVGTGFIDTLGFVFGLIDDALLWTGVACLVLVLPLLALYVRSRTTVLRVRVAGGRNLSVPVGNAPDVDEGVTALRRALGFESGPAGTSGSVDAGEAGSSVDDDGELEYGT